MKIWSVILLVFFTGCSMVNYRIDDTKYQSKGKNERISFIIIHYTAIDDEASIRALTKGQVSSHYLITTSKRDPIYNLVPDEERAWHAGISSFGNRNNLNDTSVGIEIVNSGGYKKNGTLCFYPFEESQIRKISRLLKKLSKKYDIPPKKILGHSDIAPGRKIDPGSLFPWERLYRQYGIGAWYDIEDYIVFLNTEVFNSYSVNDIQKEFKNYGYSIEVNGLWSEKNKNIIKAFQMHFRPRSITGEVDLETFAIIRSLNKKYN